jgi:hypothetical protein
MLVNTRRARGNGCSCPPTSIFSIGRLIVMHRALLLPEVVNGIADSFDILTSPLWLVAERRTSLRAMMTLNHVFSEVALDKLWAVCDPCDLARLMPSGCWYEEVQDKEDPDVIRRSTDQAWEVGKYEKRERTIVSSYAIFSLYGCIKTYVVRSCKRLFTIQSLLCFPAALPSTHEEWFISRGHSSGKGEEPSDRTY